MKKIIIIAIALVFSFLYAQPKHPYLRKQGEVTQLIVEGKPFLILGGELGNSSFTSMEYMAPIWPKLTAMHLNTVLVPVYWELIEPQEGKFDFTLYNQLFAEARKHDLKLVLLWFGSWKNSMSSHAPAWVKLDQQRFPRARDNHGVSQEILTPFSANNMHADINAFRALMHYVKDFDKNEQTIIMVQPENEIGMLPTVRDYHPLANQKFTENVPEELIQYLQKHKENLVPEFTRIWAENGYKISGTWEDVFGKSYRTDEMFMAWYFAKYTEAVTKAGKEIYPLPMYVNAALNRPGRLPGEGYPSAGPLPHLMDVWLAGMPSIDFLSPDFYNPDFEHWCDLYTRSNNPLFIPEHAFDKTVAAKAAFAFGHYEAIGFSPFHIESIENPADAPLGKVYNLFTQAMPLITAHQGQSKMDGVLFDKKIPERVLEFGDYLFVVKHSHTLGYEIQSHEAEWTPAGALIIQTADNEFYVIGSGVVITFKNKKNPELVVGILKTEEGEFVDNKWKVLRHMNGDQTHQGRHVRAFLEDYSIQRFELYNYK
ncbi:DUF5597 domain-containing protein [candidate division KSB1 bacterium]|nr:DUF5597 domain-containing protein [candidate division KSB1 bacterium]